MTIIGKYHHNVERKRHERLAVIRKVVFYVPLIVLALEHLLLGDDRLESNLAQEMPLDKSQTSTLPIFLPNLTTSITTSSSVTTVCPYDLVLVHDRPQQGHSMLLPPALTVPHTIPSIVHQTAPSHCVTKRLSNAMMHWQSNFGEYYYLHDNVAVQRLLLSEFPNWPLLKQVVEHCILYGTIQADLWRYLVLWVYGGIYADLDVVPKQLTLAMLQGEDALFVVEQYHMLSQYFMAVSPRHPLMWYAVQHSIANLLQAPDTGGIPAAMYTGPHALHQAYRDFRKDAGYMVEQAGVGSKPVWAGLFVGTNNRTVRVIGKAENENEFVNRDVLSNYKRREYKKLSMTYHLDDKRTLSGRSCLSSIFHHS